MNTLLHHFDTLRARLLASLVALFVVLFGMTLIMRAAALNSARRDAAVRAMQVAERFAAIQRQQVAQTRSLLNAVAELLPTVGPGCQRTLRSLVDQHTSLANLLMLDGEGGIQCAALTALHASYPFPDGSLLRRVAESGGFLVGSFFHAPIGRPVMHAVLMVSDPTGAATRYLVAAVDLEKLNQQAAREVPPGFVVRLTDRDGTVVLSQPDLGCCFGQRAADMLGVRQAIAAGGPQVIERARWLDGVDRLEASIPLGEPAGGVLSVGVPADSVEAPADRALAAGVTAMLVVIVLATGLVWAGAEAWILHPMRRLVDAVHRMRSGQLTAPAQLASGMAEWRALAEDFNAMAAELGVRQADLEARVAERTAELETANRELEAFAYSVSHDLRTPLRAINGFSSLVEETSAEQLSEESREHLRRVRIAAQRMGELIDGLLMLSRISRQEMKRCPVDLTALAKEVAPDLGESEPERRVSWHIAENLVADADPVLMRVLLANLLGNAWKYTSRRPSAEIEFAGQVEAGRQVFHVRDNGAGFDMAYVGKLFSAFQRLHQASEFPGTGIGLATVARIVHRHGGRVWAEAEVDKGAIFFFTLGNE